MRLEHIGRQSQNLGFREWRYKKYLHAYDAPLRNVYSFFLMQFAKWHDQTG